MASAAVAAALPVAELLVARDLVGGDESLGVGRIIHHQEAVVADGAVIDILEIGKRADADLGVIEPDQ